MYIGLRVKYLLFLSDFKETWIFSTVFRKRSNIKFHENPSIGRRVVLCVETDGQTDMAKLILAFRNFANAPKMGVFLIQYIFSLTLWFSKPPSLGPIGKFVHAMCMYPSAGGFTP